MVIENICVVLFEIKYCEKIFNNVLENRWNLGLKRNKTRKIKQ